ncbi:hypothetical protein [Polaromonas sp.]|uniref:hypothetical protein n=1 Tax=Polaromonas sp. TaxID=1869339 RepID=UPI003529EC29
MAKSTQVAGAAPRPGQRMLARNMLLAAGKLSEPNRILYERLFIKGEPESDVCREMKLSELELKSRKTGLLRALMAATTN